MSDQSPIQFLQIEEIEDAKDGRLGGQVRRALVAIAILVFGIGFAAAFVPIGGAVLGSGQIGIASNAKRVTHPTGGVISRIFVRNGQKVRKGDALVHFDDGVSGSQSSFASLTVTQLEARRARLEAEALGLVGIRFGDSLARSEDPGTVAAVRDEARLFNLRNDEQRGMAAQMSLRMVQQRREIAGYQAQISALNRQAVLIEPERQGIRELWDRGLVTISRKNELERSSVEIDRSVGALQSSIAQAEARISELRQQVISLAQTRRSQAGSELAELKSALNDQQMRSVAASDAQNRSVLRAAYDGTVDKLAFFAVGDVVRPAEPILELVPDNDELIVEASISPADINQVQVGQPARVRLSLVNSTTTPELPGRVIYVAADQVMDQRSGAAHVPVRVQIDPAAHAKLGEIKLRQGMPAEIFVETGDRSMLSYLTKPILDQLARAFRDN